MNHLLKKTHNYNHTYIPSSCRQPFLWLDCHTIGQRPWRVGCHGWKTSQFFRGNTGNIQISRFSRIGLRSYNIPKWKILTQAFPTLFHNIGFFAIINISSLLCRIGIKFFNLYFHSLAPTALPNWDDVVILRIFRSSTHKAFLRTYIIYSQNTRKHKTLTKQSLHLIVSDLQYLKLRSYIRHIWSKT